MLLAAVLGVSNPPTETVATDDRPEDIWSCQIGGRVRGLRHGADGPMRAAVERAFKEITGFDAEFTFSGWGSTLSEGRRAVVENRMPDRDKEIAEARAELAIVDPCFSPEPPGEYQQVAALVCNRIDLMMDVAKMKDTSAIEVMTDLVEFKEKMIADPVARQRCYDANCAIYSVVAAQPLTKEGGL